MCLKPEEVLHCYFNMLGDYPDRKQTIVKNFEKYYFQMRPRLQFNDLYSLLFGGAEDFTPDKLLTQRNSDFNNKPLLLY